MHDIEYSKHLMERADEFLNDGASTSVVSGDSKTSKASFINQNKEQALKRKSKLNRNKARLDEKGQRRYEELVAEIESNLDAIIADKKESLHGGDDQQSMSRYSVGSNLYSMQGDSRSLMEDIDKKLRLCNPDAVIMPLPAVGDSSTLKQGFEQSLKGVQGRELDEQSQFSMPVSGISRRSDFTMITLAQGAKQPKLPGDKSLKDKAEKRQTQARMMEIDRYLNQIRNTDDLSYGGGGGKTQTSAEQVKHIDEETLLRLLDDC